jgi:hypothetical protein
MFWNNYSNAYVEKKQIFGWTREFWISARSIPHSTLDKPIFGNKHRFETFIVLA